MIKGIFFDAAGVLYRRSAPIADYAAKLLTQENFLTIVTEQEKVELESIRLDASMGNISHRAYWHQFFLFHGVSNLEKRTEMIKKITDFSNDVLPVDGCKETLAELKKRKFKIGIISETIYPLEWKMNRLVKAGVDEFIEIVACSTDRKMHKPHPEFYLYAIDQAGLSTSESAFVGHDINELGGASRAGMLTVAFDFESGVKADYFCQSMHELLQVPEFSLSNSSLSR